MAVSGCKFSDFSGSLLRCLLEDVGHFCEPCLTSGQQVDIEKYCVDCGEYMCKSCSECHLKCRVLRDHQVVDKDKIGEQPATQDSTVCTEKCREHKQEVITYFCPQHEAFGCHVCMIMCHKTCEVDYIPDKCADIANSEEYRRTVHRLDLKLQELKEITKIYKVRYQEIDKCHHNLLQEISKYRKEINEYLDQLQQKIQKEADKKKTEDKQVTENILNECNHLYSNIKRMQSTLQANETSGKYGQLYITVKQAQIVLRSDGIKAEDGLERTNQQYILEHNNSLTDKLSEQDVFGKLNLTSVLKTPRRNMKTFRHINYKDDINVRTKSDDDECWIIGCAVLSSNKIVLADRENKKLKLVNIHTKSVIEETSLDSEPWDVAVLTPDQIAVTMPYKRQIVIMACGDRLSADHTISVTGQCKGITHHHGQLFVVCVDTFCVHILDKQGNALKKISLNREFFSYPNYLVVSEDSKLLYIGDCGKHSVVSITLQGDVTAVYENKDLYEPQGMLILDDGSLLVCCYFNDLIHHISGDLEQGRKVISRLCCPNSICYNHHLHEVYIGRCHDFLTVLFPQ